ncbi:MAG: hypothetical protein PCFJNLEI_00464 [Verrucomicrobiae bacterium]|nr:hypothetical protein [Verrucomicrobiae bacterium]
MKALLLFLLTVGMAGAETNKVRIVAGPDGWPAQIIIAADPTELPLELRAQKEIPATLLQGLGRGEQLRTPVRLVDGPTVVTEQCQVKVTGREYAVTPTGKFEALAVVFELAGVVDTVVVGNEVFPVGGAEGVVWAKSVSECFIGSGDRGFSFKAGFKPAMQLERDKAGNVTWRIFLGNQPVKFTLDVFPAQTKPVTARRQTWLTTSPDAIAGDVSPLSLHRYLAGTHAGRATQLRANLGRALVLDAGVDCARLADLTEGLTVVKALEEFGALQADGQTEFIPSWRAAPVIRYGEAFSGDDVFELAKDNPVAAVQISVWRRAGKALIAVVNESDRPVREQLYVLAPAKIFGGANRLTAAQVMAGWDDRVIPADSDWSKRRFTEKGVCLMDVTDRGLVRAAAIKGGIEVYGPVYVAPHSYRLLLGTGK